MLIGGRRWRQQSLLRGHRRRRRGGPGGEAGANVSSACRRRCRCPQRDPSAGEQRSGSGEGRSPDPPRGGQRFGGKRREQPRRRRSLSRRGGGSGRRRRRGRRRRERGQDLFVRASVRPPLDVEPRGQGPACCRGCCSCREGLGESSGEPVEGQERDLRGVDLLVFDICFLLRRRGERRRKRQRRKNDEVRHPLSFDDRSRIPRSDTTWT